MPKLNTIKVEHRLDDYISRMSADEAVALRDIKAILKLVGQQYVDWIDEEKERQRELKRTRRARTDDQAKEFGYKSIHEILTEALNRARRKLQDDLLENLEGEVRAKELRQAKTFLDAFFSARHTGKEWHSALAWANNELTRSGLPRVDGQVVSARSSRDKQVWAIEQELMQRFYNQATDHEREQQDLLSEAMGETKKRTNKRTKN